MLFYDKQFNRLIIKDKKLILGLDFVPLKKSSYHENKRN